MDTDLLGEEWDILSMASAQSMQYLAQGMAFNRFMGICL
jgi:hypothetical protein